jgi:hypothetical protein
MGARPQARVACTHTCGHALVHPYTWTKHTVMGYPTIMLESRDNYNDGGKRFAVRIVRAALETELPEVGSLNKRAGKATHGRPSAYRGSMAKGLGVGVYSTVTWRLLDGTKARLLCLR